MKMHSPGHSSEASTTASSRSAGTGGHAGRATRLALDVGAFLDIGKTVVEQGEHRRRDLLAEAVPGAEILVDPDLHQLTSLLRLLTGALDASVRLPGLASCPAPLRHVPSAMRRRTSVAVRPHLSHMLSAPAAIVADGPSDRGRMAARVWPATMRWPAGGPV